MGTRLFSTTLLRISGIRKLWETLFIRNLTFTPRSFTNSTIDKEEVSKFTRTASNWWDGTYQILQAMNTLRVPLVRDGILSVNGCSTKKSSPLEGFKIIDVGCGGGLLSEPLARLGASVTGLDPGQENIEIAIAHSLQDHEIKDRLEYVCSTVEDLASSRPNSYDALISSEVVEHVANVETFVKACVELTKKNGSLFFTTINRTGISYLASIIGAEYLLRIIPQGTHDWNKFVKPEELCEILLSLNCHIISVEGILYNPLTGRWSWCGSVSNTYTLHAVK